VELGGINLYQGSRGLIFHLRRESGAFLFVAALAAGFLLADSRLHSLQAVSMGADAVVLVNSQSSRSQDFTHFIQPYLDNFGFPYTVQDIATNAPGHSITNYAVIIIGHSQLDTNLTYLDATAQSSLSLAVSNGTGLVSFDNDLFTGGAPRYQFVQDIFGFSTGTGASGTNVSLPPTESSSQMHFITARHLTNDVVPLRGSLSLPGITVPLTTTVLAWVGGQPLVAVSRYGQGRAVQWASYGWMVSTVLGPVDGLDDVVWRGVVWAARKPFVMRGMPNLVTMRVDDVSGPFGWLHAATSVGFKPFVALFYQLVSEASAADLQTLTASGNATASFHSTGDSGAFFYFNHATEQPWPDNVQSNNFYLGTLWHTNHGIPMSKICATHYSEIGLNCFSGLKAWGMEFVPIEVVPGTVEYATPGAPWLVAGPYRLYETPQLGQVTWPTYYADWLTVPGHPEFDGQFFNIYCELRDLASCAEWCPNNSNVPGSISLATQTAKRALDSMVMATIFSHEWAITPVSTTNFQTIMQGITNSLAPYNPSYVTLDYASQYVRATRTSRLLSSAFDPVLGQVTATFSGKTDLDTGVYVFTGADNAISSIFGNVPTFPMSSNITVTLSGPPAIINAPSGRTNNAGTTALFTVGAGGAWPLSYQWYWNGTNALSNGGQVSGAASATLAVSNVLGGNAGSYSVVISNSMTSVTSTPPAVLTVVDPAILSQPVSQNGVAGATVAFSVVASGTAPTYQWLKNGAPITGATNATLSLTNVSSGDAASYSLVVSNAFGSVLSSNAVLAVYYVPTANDDSYSVPAGATLMVAAPGVLSNDTVAVGGGLKARLVSGPIHGMLSLSADGGFTYTPLTTYVGTDSFTYLVVNGPINSSVATVTLSMTENGVLFSDDFARLIDPGLLSPWVAQSGNWAVTGGALQAGTNTPQNYGYAYITNTWTDYSVEGRIRFASTGAWGGGIGGRLNTATGAHYAAWVYPEGSPDGSNLVRLIKFSTWTRFGYNGSNGAAMTNASLAAMGTNWHTLKLAFFGNQIAVYYDAKQVLSVTDVEATPYTSGGVSADLWTYTNGYTMSLSEVIVRPLVVDNSYNGTMDTTLTVAEPGILGNDTGVYPTNLVAVLVSGPTNGTLSLSTNGGFTYSPATNYYGTESFSYKANQGSNNLGTATVMIAVGLPSIIRAPSSQTNNAGTTAVFSAGAVGTLPLSYQWFWNGTNSLSDGDKLSGAHSATLTISNVLGADAGSYTVVVTNGLGSVTSSPPAVLTVVEPIITSQPVSQTNNAGTTAVFSVGAVGTLPLSHQWFKGGLLINGATNPTLTLPFISEGDVAGYSVVVSNAYGSTNSRTAELALVPKPTIESVQFTNGVAVIVWTSVAGQWYRLQYKDTVNDTSWHDVLPDFMGAGPTTMATNDLGGALQRFYQVILAPPFVITSVGAANGIALITWNSVSGQKYRLQYKHSLSDTNWPCALPDVLATGPTTTIADALGSATQRFYRVGLAPTVVPPFVITSILLTDGVAAITWNSAAGQTYRLQYKDRLTDTNWQNALPDVLATGPTTTLTNTLDSATQRYYRVALVPTGVVRPLINSIRPTNGGVTIIWNSVLNQVYRLQYKDSLSAAYWTNAGPDVTATGPTAAATDAASKPARRFYRVLLLP
jgi:hypothetical protein